MRSIQTAQRNYRRSAQELIEAVEYLYPIGSVLRVELGGHELHVEVEYHNQSWWCNPGEMRARNIKTGKMRTVRPCDVLAIVETPNE